jgi:hypothetical protein
MDRGKEESVGTWGLRGVGTRGRFREGATGWLMEGR